MLIMLGTPYLIHHNYFGLPEQCPSDTEELSLPLREVFSAFEYLETKTLGDRLHKLTHVHLQQSTEAEFDIKAS